VFETTFEKIQQSTSAAQKEKYEAELKKEIKKLQRYREQIKSWISNSEIKDKRSLMDNRKLIENLMERFKALEREVKTKAFSKDGLNREPKIDPAEKEKSEIAQWIGACVDKLQVQIEAMEAEMEILQGAMRKNKKHDQEKFKNLENKITRHKHHQTKLELILRMMENGNLEPDQVFSSG
jgi:CCR4-NOT transcription complex subunit 3